MEVIEYRVRPVTRYIITKHTTGENYGGCESMGQFDHERSAIKVAAALAKNDGGIFNPPPVKE